MPSLLRRGPNLALGRRVDTVCERAELVRYCLRVRCIEHSNCRVRIAHGVADSRCGVVFGSKGCKGWGLHAAKCATLAGSWSERAETTNPPRGRVWFRDSPELAMLTPNCAEAGNAKAQKRERTGLGHIRLSGRNVDANRVGDIPEAVER